MKKYDVIVIGLGGMGSSAVYHLAKSGKRVLGIEQFGLAHSLGSSHGKSRLIRKAYFEHPSYVPLLERSYLLWDELSKRTGRKLFHQTGLIIYGPESGGNVLPGIRQSAKQFQLNVEDLSASECRERFPKFRVPEGFVGIYESTGGYLEVENCIEAACNEAEKFGAILRFNEHVVSWNSGVGSVSVKTASGTYEAEKLVITAGPWSQSLLKEFGMELKVRRVPLFWFPCRSGFTEEEGLPCFAYDLPYGFIYGFPNCRNEGLKVAPHIPGNEVADPTSIDRREEPLELEPVVRCIRENIPEVSLTPSSSAVCMYTMSVDSHFIIDRHPKNERVLFAAGFSGHGFKFASVIGEILSDLSSTGKTSQPIDFLRIRR